METVSFEIAKKLKEKGFPQRPDYFNYSSYYDWDGLRKIHSLSNASVWFDPNINRDNIYFAPTISQVLKWLREEKKIHIAIDLWLSGYAAMIYTGISKENNNFNWKDFYNDQNKYETYELATIAGIEYVIDNLI